MATEALTATLTLGRADEIETGQGPPPTDAELLEFAERMARLQRSPSWQRMEKGFAAARKVVAKLESEKVVEGLSIYKAAPPAQQRRMAHMTGRQIVATQTWGFVSCQSWAEPATRRP